MHNSVFVDYMDPSDLDDNLGYKANPVVRTDLLSELRTGRVSGLTDIDAALDIVKVVRTELEGFGTDGSNTFSEDEIERGIKSLNAVLVRCGINSNIPFRNFAAFRHYWIKNDCANSWQARRNCLFDIFEPIHKKIDELETKQLKFALPETTGLSHVQKWQKVDEELSELSNKYKSSVTPQDFRSLGPHMIGVLEALGRVVYEPAVHDAVGEKNLPEDRIKDRLTRFVYFRLAGSDNKELRALVIKAIELAHQVKHKTIPSPEMAGISCDSVILVASMLRRLSDAKTTPVQAEEKPF